MTRESVWEETANAIRDGTFALIMPVITSTEGRCVASTRWMPTARDFCARRMIKANVPSRIAFAVSSQTDSRVILDANGAESLLGQGDMLFKPLGTSRLQRVQGAFVTEDEIALVVEQARAQREQQVDETFLELPQVFVDESDSEDGEFDPDEDALLDKAIEVVVTAQTASVSLLQRRLRVGYTRAGRLIDMLERRGIISPYEGSKPRRVLISEHELERVAD